jgi:hypothetical protein
VKDDLDVGFVSALGLNSAGAWSLDELRVGATWQSVTPREPAFRLRLAEEKNGREHVLLKNRVVPQELLPEGRLLRFEFVGEAHGAEIDSRTGEIRWVPGELAGGQSWNFRVRAVEDAEPGNSAVLDLPIWVEEANQVAVIRPVAPVWVMEGETLHLELVADDLDRPAQQLRFHLVEGPEGMVVGDNGELRWTPASGQWDDTFLARVSVDDGMDLGPELRILVNTRSVSRVVADVPELLAGSVGESVRLSWPAESAGNWGLEVSDSLSVPRWALVDQVPVLREGRREIEVRAENAFGFFRLAGRAGSGRVLTNMVVRSPGNLFGGRSWVELQLETRPGAGHFLELLETSDAFERVRRIPYEFLEPAELGVGFWLQGDDLLLGQTLVQARLLNAAGSRVGGVGLMVTNEPVSGNGVGPNLGTLKWGGSDGVVRVAPDTNGFVMPWVELEVSDPDGDLERVELNWVGPSGERGSALRELRWQGPGSTNWVYLPFVFDSTTALGQWELTVRVHDAAGHRVQGSARLEHVATSFLPGTLSPPTVWNVTPTHAAPGELIQVRVRDVDRVDLTNSVVRGRIDDTEGRDGLPRVVSNRRPSTVGADPVEFGAGAAGAVSVGPKTAGGCGYPMECGCRGNHRRWLVPGSRIRTGADGSACAGSGDRERSPLGRRSRGENRGVTGGTRKRPRERRVRWLGLVGRFGGAH